VKRAVGLDETEIAVAATPRERPRSGTISSSSADGSVAASNSAVRQAKQSQCRVGDGGKLERILEASVSYDHHVPLIVFAVAECEQPGRTGNQSSLGAMLFAAVRGLALRIDGATTEILSLEISPEFTRKTTLVQLRGGGHEGVGEDVTYNPTEHDADRFQQLDLAGDWTLASLFGSPHEIDLFPAGEPDQPAYRD